MMLYPPMSELTKNIPNRYLMVNVIARRARQIAEDTNVEETDKPVTIAIHEIADGKYSATKSNF